MMLSETDQSEATVLTTESKHEARDTQQLQLNKSVIDIIFRKLSALTLTSLLCKPVQDILIQLRVLWSVANHCLAFGRHFQLAVE